MISFAVYQNGRLAERLNLNGAYAVGVDDVPLRAEITFKAGIITCRKRAGGPAGLALLWEAADVGTILLETIRVVERDRPYILQVELARGRLMRITHKLEDWGVNDFESATDFVERISAARGILVQALKADDPAEAAELGDEALAEAIKVSEDLSRFHAQAFLVRRKQSGGLGKRALGCTATLDKNNDIARKRLTGAFDFVTLPIVWRDVEPTEQAFNWKLVDSWVEALSKSRTPIRGTELLSFNVRNIPDWLYIWEHDFDTIRDLAFEHVRRVLNRFGQHIQNWVVVSGIHAPNCFTFSFEQLIELTRMATALTKQLSPRGTTIIELTAPWGEYYARNQRTIPPTLFADMCIQSGLNFDAFGLQFIFGPATDGNFVRDMFQISTILEAFSKLGKPIHVTAAQVPSEVRGHKPEPAEAPGSINDGGSWHGPWSDQIQAQWLRDFYAIALSKVFVESVSWNAISDQSGRGVPMGGLLRSDLAPKSAYKDLLSFREEIFGQPKTGIA
ncbi:MAG: endo-1,4-beta-xylanase [Planctomycetes bacterium]|nr:endo-1,4-beta-xylanase [Planctomycetota bacterium]MBI3834416.1 endo-1,4-beta-xylanase [Planctomycetota bacterium]